MTISYYPADATKSSVGPPPWGLQVVRGLVPGVTAVNLFGYHDTVGTAFMTLWEGAADYVFPTSAGVMTLVSSSASDTGTAKVLISGLDTNWALQSETVTLNGTTPVTTANSYLRINSMVLTGPASGNTTNVGNITLYKAAAPAVIYGQINAGIGRMQNSFYSVPAGYNFYLNNVNAYSGDVNGNGYVKYRVQNTNNALANPTTFTVLQTTFQLSFQILRTNPFPYGEKTDVRWQFAVNTGTHEVSIVLEAVLIAN